MLHVHQRGVGICGIFSYEVAETTVNQVMDFARENQHPLQCTLEKALAAQSSVRRDWLTRRGASPAGEGIGPFVLPPTLHQTPRDRVPDHSAEIIAVILL